MINIENKIVLTDAFHNSANMAGNINDNPKILGAKARQAPIKAQTPFLRQILKRKTSCGRLLQLPLIKPGLTLATSNLELILRLRSLSLISIKNSSQ